MKIYSMEQCPNGHSFDPRLHGRVCPNCGMAVPRKNETISLAKTQDELDYELINYTVDPVVGWLVCIKGPQTGQCYILHKGMNAVGKDGSMDVVILGDPEISARNHVFIGYDEKIREFKLVPGESKGIVRLKGEGVYSAVTLVDLDLITIGRTVLLFKPLCGDNFGWAIDNEPIFDEWAANRS